MRIRPWHIAAVVVALLAVGASGWWMAQADVIPPLGGGGGESTPTPIPYASAVLQYSVNGAEGECVLPYSSLEIPRIIREHGWRIQWQWSRSHDVSPESAEFLLTSEQTGEVYRYDPNDELETVGSITSRRRTKTGFIDIDPQARTTPFVITAKGGTWSLTSLPPEHLITRQPIRDLRLIELTATPKYRDVRRMICRGGG